jgi:NAD(P)-dependent dehydrogenase (short-subunit alcohol dehydrogenase family)
VTEAGGHEAEAGPPVPDGGSGRRPPSSAATAPSLQFGAYRAATWAVECLSQSLRQEVAGSGIHVTRVEPGPYATGFAARDLRAATPCPPPPPPEPDRPPLVAVG